jgi:hypothetical protein
MGVHTKSCREGNMHTCHLVVHHLRVSVRIYPTVWCGRANGHCGALENHAYVADEELLANARFGSGGSPRQTHNASFGVPGRASAQTVQLAEGSLIIMHGQCRMQPVGFKNLGLFGVGCQPLLTKHSVCGTGL